MQVQKGFTLIELAVVIAIIGILAAVAIPRFGDTTIQAERAKAKDLATQLSSAAALYTAEQGTTPNNFSNFVEYTAVTPTQASGRTISVATANLGSGVNCATGSPMVCTFNKWTVTYTYAGGAVTAAGTARAGTGNSMTF